MQATPSVGFRYDTTQAGGRFVNGLRPTGTVYPDGRVVRLGYAAGRDDVLNRVSFLADDAGGQSGPHLAEYQFLGAAGNLASTHGNEVHR